MKLIITLTLLIGWLVLEIKDFCFNGGLSHSLAFGLLKITLILTSIVVIILMVFWVNVVPIFVGRGRHKKFENVLGGVPPIKNEGENEEKIINKPYRKNSF